MTDEFGDRPSLGDRSLGTMRRITVKNLGYRAKTGLLLEMIEQGLPIKTNWLGAVKTLIRTDKWTDQPSPNRTLVIGAITVLRRTSIIADIF